jgi:electron transfer flavoprotein alpha/beta subunit
VQSGINKPRYPSLSNIMRAAKQELAVISIGDDDTESVWECRGGPFCKNLHDGETATKNQEDASMSRERETHLHGTVSPIQPDEALLRVAYPGKARAGVFLQGSRKDKALQLLNILRERSLLH